MTRRRLFNLLTLLSVLLGVALIAVRVRAAWARDTIRIGASERGTYFARLGDTGFTVLCVETAMLEDGRLPRSARPAQPTRVVFDAPYSLLGTAFGILPAAWFAQWVRRATREERVPL